MKRMVLLSCLLIGYVVSYAAQVYNLVSKVASEKVSAAEPKCEVSSDGTSYMVSLSFEEVTFEEDNVYIGRYFVNIPGYGQTAKSASPSLPFSRLSVLLPDGVTPVVRVVDMTTTDIDIDIAPARVSVPISEVNGYNRENVPMIEYYSGYSANAIVSICDQYVFRGSTIADVGIIPAQYSVDEKKLRLCKKLVFSIEFQKNTNSEGSISTNIDVFSGFVPCDNERGIYMFPKAITENGLMALSTLVNPLTPKCETEELLIVTSPQYQSAAEELVKWKQKDGYYCVLWSDNNWTADVLRQDILSYAADHPRLSALIIIGNIDVVPSFPMTWNPFKDPNYYTDKYYACLDGLNDEYPDILYGRLPVNNIDEASAAVSKIVKYESGEIVPLTQFNSPITKALIGSVFQSVDYDGQRERECIPFVQTAETIVNGISPYFQCSRVYERLSWSYPKYFYDGTLLPEFLQYPAYSWNGNATDITNIVNNGVGMIMYYSHGEPTQWDNPAWSIDDLYNLRNTQWFPLVFNVSCSTGKMDEDNFSRRLLVKTNSGAAGVLAGTTSSYVIEGRLISLGLMQALFPQASIAPGWTEYTSRCNRVGDVIASALAYMKRLNSPESYSLFHYNVFHWYGDPTMVMYTEHPSAINNIGISYSSTNTHVTVGEDNIKISAVYSNGDVQSFKLSEAYFPSAGCESITFTGVNKISKTISFGEIAETDNTALGTYMQSAILRSNRLYVNYNLGNNISGSLFVKPSDNKGTIVVSKIDGTITRSFECTGANNQIEIDMSTMPMGYYSITLMHYGNAYGSVSVGYMPSYSRN